MLSYVKTWKKITEITQFWSIFPLVSDPFDSLRRIKRETTRLRGKWKSFYGMSVKNFTVGSDARELSSKQKQSLKLLRLVINAIIYKKVQL